ncbi:hypothetical protein [Plantactinospora sp. KLBMP9567]|uniref:hypothetical protein n=1 Tax=Plantactinospora sp. KLBMP9567 TaxID=3085900 RepID=UPI002982462A|nr:hypothetical protein [Plantactinospora sp. KLBMP9567]MDW5327135.1 hypothetical protein [Plantactinospora sp. KLBMP9567]
MLDRQWLTQDQQFAPGRELFRCSRQFAVWAYTVSHSQLLLRARTTGTDGGRQTRIDVLFKPVEAVKTRMEYRDGLVIRCATTDERDRILADAGLAGTNFRVFVLPTSDGIDHVVVMGVGWCEDEQEDREPSSLAFFVPATDPTRVLPTPEPVPWSTLQMERW